LSSGKDRKKGDKKVFVNRQGKNILILGLCNVAVLVAEVRNVKWDGEDGQDYETGCHSLFAGTTPTFAQSGRGKPRMSSLR
jgi:hypothetical protein